MGEFSDHINSLIFKNGQFSPFLGAPSGPTQLADFDFSSPVVQNFPLTPSGLAGALGDEVATPSFIWSCQETSGNLVDSVASEALVPTNSPLQGQTAVGLWDGFSYTDRNAVGEVATGAFISGDNTVMDSAGTSMTFLVVFRTRGLANVEVVKKRTAAGYLVRITTGGDIHVFIQGASSSGFVGNLTGTLDDGAWHYLCVKIDTTADTSTTFTDEGSASGSIAGFGSLSNTAFFGLFEAAIGSEGCQLAYAATFEGAAAEAIDQTALDNFWVHASDPTGLLTTQTRNSLISVPVSASAVSHFTPDSLPIGYDGGFSDTNKLGLYCNTAVTNLIANSEDFTDVAWVATNVTKAGDDADSPDGFRSASKLTVTAANGNVAHLFTTVAATEYTLSFYLKENTVGVTGRLIFYDETGAAELASQVFTGSATWAQRITVTATTNGGQVSSSFRIEIDTNTEALNPWGAQAETGATAGAYVRTLGSTAVLVASSYEATGNLINIPVGEISATVMPTRDLTGVIKAVCDSNASVTDQRYLYLDTSDRVAAELRGGATSETITNTGVSITYGVERNIRLLWDVQDSSLGFETLLVDAGSTTNGDALPYEQSHGSGFTGISIGAAFDGSANFDGFIQSIKSYDGQNGNTP